MFTPIQITLIVLWITIFKWESYNTQAITKYANIVLVGFVVGVIMGDIRTGLIVGGTLELMQLGLIGTAGSSVPDYQIGACVGTAFAIASKQSTGAGLVIAIPVATLSINFDVLSKVVSAYPVHKIRRLFIEGKNKRAYRYIIWGSWMRPVFTGTIPVLIYLLMGSLFVNELLAAAPKWIINGVSMAGALLPAVGLCLLIRTLPLRTMYRYLIIGFLVMILAKPPLLIMIVLGAVYAFAFYVHRHHVAISSSGVPKQSERQAHHEKIKY